MDCKNCELKKRNFTCNICVRKLIRHSQAQIRQVTADRDEQVLKASKHLDFVEEPRTRRAQLGLHQRRVDDVMVALTKLRKDNDRKRDRLRKLREDLASRRRTLSAARLSHVPLSTLPSREAQELRSLASAIARARYELVQELVDVFTVVEVGGRPPVGGKAGSKGEWTIGGLILPVPGDMRRYPPDHINAVITHTLQFLSLLTFYLGVKLPFEMTWTGEKLGVGQPFIGAGKGGESGGWAKWYKKHPLHVSANAALVSLPEEDPSTSRTRRTSLSGAIPVSSESYIEAEITPQPQASFTTALAMLLYNVCYLAYTQNVDIQLSQAGDILSNLWSVCCSSELGRHSHETTPYLSPPTPVTFGLDFAQLLQATTSNPASRPGRRSTKPSRRSTDDPQTSAAHRKQATIVEIDEDGWDLVEGGEDSFS
ncbi:hypothetical protein BDN72DRAFT_823190 [Pluteus cervinus]|uniref:Uncharacterized protein n=1 Tax=Pluteus cervinus TaxID=181527 RepID=A0ACD3AM77_9AGAR|nr:hypothetical protein BDN72DRAFT_823190 [Pluteus cervinus]